MTTTAPIVIELTDDRKFTTSSPVTEYGIELDALGQYDKKSLPKLLDTLRDKSVAYRLQPQKTPEIGGFEKKIVLQSPHFGNYFHPQSPDYINHGLFSTNKRKTWLKL